LLAKQDQLRSFIDNSQVGILIVGEEGRIIEWNKACEQLMGIKANRVLGRTIWDVTMDVLPPSGGRRPFGPICAVDCRHVASGSIADSRIG
jgi:PAS domain-containing protein